MHAALLSLVRAYQQQGPVFRLPTPTGALAVMAGPQANLFLAQGGHVHFSNHEFYAHFVQELGSENFVVALDGEPHRHLRTIMKPAFTWETIARYFPHFVQTTHALVEAWQPGERVDASRMFRRLITDQTSLAMTNHAAGDSFELFARFFRTAVTATLGRYAPQELAQPQYLEAKEQVFRLLRQLLAERRVTGAHEEPDYLDLLLEARDLEEQPLSDPAVLAAMLVPFFAGIDTVAYTSVFMLHQLLTDHALRAELLAEIDEAFAGGAPDLDVLKNMSLLRGVTMETLRIYPVAPGAVRTVAEPFAFAGHRLEAGTQVYVATPVTHFLPELFPEPFRFDPRRYEAPRYEHRKPGAYAPFFKGSHTCPGAGMGEVQVMLTIGLLLHHFELAVDPAYHLELTADPILRPARSYQIQVLGRRAPLPIAVPV